MERLAEDERLRGYVGVSVWLYLARRREAKLRPKGQYIFVSADNADANASPHGTPAPNVILDRQVCGLTDSSPLIRLGQKQQTQMGGMPVRIPADEVHATDHHVFQINPQYEFVFVTFVRREH